MESFLFCLAFILIIIVFALVITALLATVMSIFTLITRRHWGWRDHFSRCSEATMKIASFLISAVSSGGHSSSSTRSSSRGSSGGSFKGGSSRGGGSGRSF